MCIAIKTYSRASPGIQGVGIEDYLNVTEDTTIVSKIVKNIAFAVVGQGLGLLVTT